MFKVILIVAVAVACTQAAVNRYQNPTHHAAKAHDGHDEHAETLRFDSDIHEDGSYKFGYETSNGISASESGLGGHQADGSYSYISPEGEHVDIRYVADENGFHPSGDVLPVAPPIPPQILKALEYIRSHPAYDEHQQHSHSQPGRRH